MSRGDFPGGDVMKEAGIDPESWEQDTDTVQTPDPVLQAVWAAGTDSCPDFNELLHGRNDELRAGELQASRLTLAWVSSSQLF